MANFTGFTESPQDGLNRLGGLVDIQPPTALPLGVGCVVRNTRFALSGMGTRYGVQNQFASPAKVKQPITGLLPMVLNSFPTPGVDTQTVVGFDYGGSLFIESPAGSGNTAVIVPQAGSNVIPPEAAFMKASQAQNRAYMAFSTLLASAGKPAVWNPTLNRLDPFTMKPYGWNWVTKTNVVVGDVATPSTTSFPTGNAHCYRCIQAGTTGVTEPIWPAVYAAEIDDGSAVWQEYTPVLTQTLIPPPAPVVQYLPNGASGGVQLAAVGGTAPYTWTETGDLPDGLSLATDGLISGTPTTAGTFPFTVKATDTLGVFGTKLLSITIGPAPEVRPIPPPPPPDPGAGVYVVTSSLPDGAVGVVYAPGSGGMDFYIGLTFVNAFGETTLSPLYIYVNTSGTDAFVISYPVIQAWMTNIQKQYRITQVNVYVGWVATGGAPPIMYGYGAFTTGMPFTVNSGPSGSGPNPPTVNGAYIVPAGNVDNDVSGLRWAVPFWENYNATRFAWNESAAVSCFCADSLHGLYMANIAIGPNETAARCIGLSVADQSAAGDYFLIPSADTITAVTPQIPIPPTRIPNNTATTAFFNFTDSYLEDSESVDNNSDAIEIQSAIDMYFSPSTQRMMVTGILGDDSALYISLSTDLESIYGSSGRLTIAENNGQKLMCAREWNGTIYALKERSGHVITPSAGEPNTWNAVQQWDKFGAVAPGAVSSGAGFIAFYDQTGLYYYQAGTTPVPVWMFQPNLVARVNLAYKHLIWVYVDDVEQEIRVGVPLDDATTISHQFVINFREGLADPIHFSSISGKMIATGEPYKWSVDDVPANVCVRAQRTLVDPTGLVNKTFLATQLLMGSANLDGQVFAPQPGTKNDNGVGILHIYDTACFEATDSICMLGGVTVQAFGSGTLSMWLIPGKALYLNGEHPQMKGIQLRDIELDPEAIKDFARQCRGQGEKFRIRFTNGGRPDSVLNVNSVSLWSRPLFTARTSS